MNEVTNVEAIYRVSTARNHNRLHLTSRWRFLKDFAEPLRSSNSSEATLEVKVSICRYSDSSKCMVLLTAEDSQ